MGIILVYDITNYTSFNNIPKWLKAIQEHANEDVEKMLIGNRSDKEDERVIPKERGEVIAKENNILFFETSAKTGVNIDYAFTKFVEAIMDKNMNVLEDQVQFPSSSSSSLNVFMCCST